MEPYVCSFFNSLIAISALGGEKLVLFGNNKLNLKRTRHAKTYCTTQPTNGEFLTGKKNVREKAPHMSSMQSTSQK
jgi:hypothetical protein